MGLSNFPSPAEGVVPLLVMKTVMWVALVKNKLRSVLQVVGAVRESDESRSRKVSITRYGSLCCGAVECCVCLCRFEADEELSHLSCNHFFHKPCLDKWFDNQRVSCPLCRSIF